MAAKWISRLGSKASGFSYADETGRPVRDRRTLARIDALRVPPAWRDVRIAASRTSAIQAWGFDVRGRRQYRYHPRAAEKGQLRKYYRVRRMGHELPRLRRQLRDASRRPGLDRATVAAIVVRLISEGFFRPGSESSTRQNATFGITTLRKSHVSVDGQCLVFRYVAKGRKRLRQCVVNGELTHAVARLLKTPGRRLFRYRAGDGTWRDLQARDVNEFLRDELDVRYSAKDFRTWGGTLRAAIVLAELGPPAGERDAKRRVATAMRFVSADLGNMPTICRKSYVHPLVIARYLDDGETIALSRRSFRRADGVAHSPEERALLQFLDRHFPDRRRAHRDAGRDLNDGRRRAA